MRLFKRKTQIIIGSKGNPNGTLIEDIRISFDIEMNDKKETNTGKISIWNLSQEKMSLLDDKDAFVILKVGYDEEPSIIFIGDVIEFSPQYQGVDLITEITLKDGYIPLANRKLSLSFAANSSTSQILNKIIGDLNLVKGDYSGLPNFVYRQGFSFIGSPAKALDTILNRIDYEWTIANNILIISQTNKTNKTIEVQLLTPETGLLDSPQRLKQKPTKKKVRDSKVQDPRRFDGWTFKTLILSGLVPKNIVKVESKTVKGVFIIKNVRFVGDTHTDDWRAEIQAIEK